MWSGARMKVLGSQQDTQRPVGSWIGTFWGSFNSPGLNVAACGIEWQGGTASPFNRRRCHCQVVSIEGTTEKLPGAEKKLGAKQKGDHDRKMKERHVL